VRALAVLAALRYRTLMPRFLDIADHARLPWRFHGLTGRITARP